MDLSASPPSLSSIAPPASPARRANRRGLSLSIPSEGGRTASSEIVSPAMVAAGPSIGKLGSSMSGLTLNVHDENGGDVSSSSNLLSAPSLGGLVKAPRKAKPSRLSLAPPALINQAATGVRSVPNSPVRALSVGAATTSSSATLRGASSKRDSVAVAEKVEQETKALRDNLRGAPRRRPSMPFVKRAPPKLSLAPTNASSRPSIWQDPSEHVLSGKGSTLQHARSVYAAGPVEVLKGVFLGDEHNACDSETLSDLGITMILNVAKETELPFQREMLEGSSYSASSEVKAADGIDSNALRIPLRSPHGITSARTPTTATSCKASVYAAPVSSVFPPPKTPSFPPPLLDTQQSALAASPESSLGEPSPPQYLRNTTSTPNLLLAFNKGTPTTSSRPTAAEPAPMLATGSRGRSFSTLPAIRRSSRGVAGAAEDTLSEGEGTFASSSAASSTTNDTATTVGTSPPSPSIELNGVADSGRQVLHSGEASPSPSMSVSEADSFTNVSLPDDALALSIPPSPMSGRMTRMRYVKLPWTHDETDLAQPSGGFSVGCALIAETLQVGPFAPRKGEVPREPPGKILVHCQCGVSRSATLVIAFVMQAAALSYPLDGAAGLTGMHDCYTLVKDISASISPNCSLIYQLVEWERHLSAEVNRLREAFGISGSLEGPAAGNAAEGVPPAAAGWAGEAMGEEEWTRMRLEEEQKEADEDERLAKERLELAKKAAAEARAKRDAETAAAEAEEEHSPSDGLDPPGDGLMARRRKRTPSLQLGGSSSGASSEAPSSDPPALASIASSGKLKRPSSRKGPPKPLSLNNAAKVEAALPTSYATPTLVPDEAYSASSSLSRAVQEEDEEEASLATPSASKFSDASKTVIVGTDAPVSPVHRFGPTALLRSQSDGPPMPSESMLMLMQNRPPPTSSMLANDGGEGRKDDVSHQQQTVDRNAAAEIDRRRSLHGASNRNGAGTPPLRNADPRRKSAQTFGLVAGAAPPPPHTAGGLMAASPSVGIMTPSKSLHSFGASRQSALERKDRHRRTFSSDLPASFSSFSREVGVKLNAAAAAKEDEER